ncbi:MAG: hypothetical protein JO047_07725, partial [Alphaproteobacteria bacterium]|nr:hypothetical protein [Alphaproteobacteria bacterium]
MAVLARVAVLAQAPERRGAERLAVGPLEARPVALVPAAPRRVLVPQAVLRPVAALHLAAAQRLVPGWPAARAAERRLAPTRTLTSNPLPRPAPRSRRTRRGKVPRRHLAS